MRRVSANERWLHLSALDVDLHSTLHLNRVQVPHRCAHAHHVRQQEGRLVQELHEEQQHEGLDWDMYEEQRHGGLARDLQEEVLLQWQLGRHLQEEILLQRWLEWGLHEK